MRNTSREIWKSLSEWKTSVFQRWWDVLNIPIAAIPLLIGIVDTIIKTRNATPPLPLWDILLLGGGTILFIVVTFWAFHQIRLERDEIKSKDLPISDSEIKQMEWRKEYRETYSSEVSRIPVDLKNLWGIVEELVEKKKKDPKPSEDILVKLILTTLEINGNDPIFNKENYNSEDRMRKTIKELGKRMGLKKSNPKLEATWRRRIADDMDDLKIGLELMSVTEFANTLSILNEDRATITKTKIDNTIDGFIENLSTLYSLELFIYYGGTMKKLYTFPREIRDSLKHLKDNIEKVVRTNFTQVKNVLEEYSVGKELKD